MTTNALMQSVNVVSCLRYRHNKKKKYKLNNQQMFERSKRNLKASWNLTINDSRTQRSINTKAMNSEMVSETIRDFILYTDFYIHILLYHIIALLH